jgi:hypothetical protein
MDPRIRIHNSDSNRIQVSYNNIDVKMVVVSRQASLSVRHLYRLLVCSKNWLPA